MELMSATALDLVYSNLANMRIYVHALEPVLCLNPTNIIYNTKKKKKY